MLDEIGVNAYVAPDKRFLRGLVPECPIIALSTNGHEFDRASPDRSAGAVLKAIEFEATSSSVVGFGVRVRRPERKCSTIQGVRVSYEIK